MEKQKQRFEIVEIPTQTALVFKDNSTDEVLDMNQYLLRLGNELSELKEGLVGKK
jgi:regulator of sigma D